MTNDFRMSYFMPPIAPIKNELGRIVTPATLIPLLRSLRRTSFSNDNLQRESQNSDRNKYAIPEIYGQQKHHYCLYVTPCGTFSRRKQQMFL